MKKIKYISFFLSLACLIAMVSGCGTSTVFGFNRDSEKFQGDCGVAISANVVDSDLFSKINITVKNTSSKDIHAIKIYAVPLDVYGDEIDTFFDTQNQIFIDSEIRAGDTYSVDHTVANSSAKTVKLYLYSVFFADQTEWGDRNAAYNTIKNHGRVISLNGRFD